MKRETGLTLVEILIAIIILTIGMISILSLFPSSIKTTKFSVEDTMSANIAESVADALTGAMRSAIPENPQQNKPAEVTLIHDGLPNGSYKFALPLPNDPPPDKVRFFAHPANNPTDVSSPNATAIDVFKLGKTDFIKKILDDIKKGPDPTESYDQYGFSFTISRIDDSRSPQETGIKFKAKPLYQFAIAIYRLSPTYEKSKLPQPIKVFVILLAGE